MQAVMLQVLIALATGHAALHAASASLAKPVPIPTQVVGARHGQIGSRTADARAVAAIESAFRLDLQKPQSSFRVLVLRRDLAARDVGDPILISVPTIATDVFNHRRQTEKIDASPPEQPEGADLPGPSLAMVASETAFPPGNSRSDCSSTMYRPAGFLDWQTEQRRAAHYALMSTIAWPLRILLRRSSTVRSTDLTPASCSRNTPMI